MYKGFFHCRFAFTNLKKNSRLYIPQILTGGGLTAIFYIILTLTKDNMLGAVRGGRFLPTILRIGVIVVAVLSVILIFYTNSFLMKQRKREFGLYNVLGMERRHVGRIMFFEMLISAVTAIIGGMAAGIILYKLCVVFICRILKVKTVLGFYYISPVTIIPTLVFFGGLYLVIYLFNRIQMMWYKPVDLLVSVQAGEREPKIKWLFLVIGVVSLGGGYYLAYLPDNPLQALYMFFAAVILVIIGTYCLFIAGSIAILKLLKGNKRFYYQSGHMTAVSGLLYRMKQNAVGLASICILATGVLIMLSTTVSLYVGIETTIRRQNPHDLIISMGYETDSDIDAGSVMQTELLDIVREAAKDQDVKITYEATQNYLSGVGVLEDQELSFNLEEVLVTANLAYICVISSEEYERITGMKMELAEAELAVYSLPANNIFLGESLRIGNRDYVITDQLSDFPVDDMMENQAIYSCFGFVVDERELERIYEEQKNVCAWENWMQHTVVYDFEGTDEQIEILEKTIENRSGQRVNKLIKNDPGAEEGFWRTWNSKLDKKEYIYGLNGSLLFLGLILGFVFLFATVLIIYYKQISEGCEDRERFQIMQKLGMSSAEVRKTINFQILMVFFLPIAVAAVHVMVAFSILLKMMRMFYLTSTLLFVSCTVGAFLIFVVIYAVVYGITARTYYKIVG